MEELRNFIAELPGEDGWYKDGDSSFLKHGETLIKKGISLEFIKEMFEDLYNAVSSEFGA